MMTFIVWLLTIPVAVLGISVLCFMLSFSKYDFNKSMHENWSKVNYAELVFWVLIAMVPFVQDVVVFSAFLAIIFHFIGKGFQKLAKIKVFPKPSIDLSKR